MVKFLICNIVPPNRSLMYHTVRSTVYTSLRCNEVCLRYRKQTYTNQTYLRVCETGNLYKLLRHALHKTPFKGSVNKCDSLISAYTNKPISRLLSILFVLSEKTICYSLPHLTQTAPFLLLSPSYHRYLENTSTNFSPPYFYAVLHLSY